jgi:uncharacterized protein YjbJ (UPF0337 family)
MAKQADSKRRSSTMKPSTKANLEGNLHELKGTATEKAGQLIDNSDLAAEGQVEKVGGKLQKKVARLQKVVGH